MSRLPAETATIWSPALQEASSRLKLLKRTAIATTVLNPSRAATQQLAERLLGALREGMGFCSHFDPARPNYTIWVPGARRLSCTPCMFVAQARHEDDGDTCDLCGRERPGETGGVAVMIGPVGTLAVLCRPCTTKRMRATYDLASAGRQVIGILEARRREAAS